MAEKDGLLALLLRSLPFDCEKAPQQVEQDVECAAADAKANDTFVILERLDDIQAINQHVDRKSHQHCVLDNFTCFATESFEEIVVTLQVKLSIAHLCAFRLGVLSCFL